MADDDKLITLVEVAQKEYAIDGDRPRPGLFHSHPWNIAPPKPEEPVPEVPPRYQLTVRHSHEMREGSEELCSLRAESDSRESLLELNGQLEALNYSFVCLSRIA